MKGEALLLGHKQLCSDTTKALAKILKYLHNSWYIAPALVLKTANSATTAIILNSSIQTGAKEFMPGVPGTLWYPAPVPSVVVIRN